MGSLKASLLVSGSDKTTDEVLEAIALLCGALPGKLVLDVGNPCDDAVLWEMVRIMEPAGVKVKRGYRYPQPHVVENHAVATLIFEHIPPIARKVQR